MWGRITYTAVAVFITSIFSIQPLYSSDIECFFDIHDVIARPNKIQRIFYALRDIPAYASILFNRDTYTEIRKTIEQNGARGAEAYIVAAERAKNQKLAHALRIISGTYSIDPNMHALLLQLQQDGIPLHIASNIGTLTYNDLRAKYPDVFDLFKKHYIVDYRAENVISKPDIRFFQRIVKEHNPYGTKTLIFIDDILENVQSARKAGMVGIHFKNSKQFAHELALIGMGFCSSDVILRQ